jgi:arsenate reductase (thioredoxin)
MSKKKKVVFICTQNSIRSQMAEALLNHLYPDRLEAYSAGTAPSRVNPLTIAVMKELGIDLSKARSKGIDEFSGQDFDYIITVCDHAKENCPYFAGKGKRIHKGFEDPYSSSSIESGIIENFRKTRDEIKGWIEDFFSKSF